MKTTFDQNELNEMGKWVNGINPMTTAEDFDRMIDRIKGKLEHRKDGFDNTILLSLLKDYEEARVAYGK